MIVAHLQQLSQPLPKATSNEEQEILTSTTLKSNKQQRTIGTYFNYSQKQQATKDNRDPLQLLSKATSNKGQERPTSTTSKSNKQSSTKRTHFNYFQKQQATNDQRDPLQQLPKATSNLGNDDLLQQLSRTNSIIWNDCLLQQHSKTRNNSNNNDILQQLKKPTTLFSKEKEETNSTQKNKFDRRPVQSKLMTPVRHPEISLRHLLRSFG